MFVSWTTKKTKEGLLPLFSCAGVLVLLLACGLSAQSVYVPLNHWAYEFIERFEAKGVVTGALNGTKPYSREEMTGYLLQIEDKVNGGYKLNSVEENQFQFLRFEFGEEFLELTGSNGAHYPTRIEQIKNSRVFGKVFPGFMYRNNRNLLDFHSEVFHAYIDPIFYQQVLYANPDTVGSTERVHERTHGFTLRGRLGTHLGFFFDFRDTKEWGTRDYPNQFDISREGLGFVNGYGTHIWHDETNAYLMGGVPYLQVMLGKDWNVWGPGYRGSLALSGNATSYDQIKLQSRVWRLKFTWLLGFLRTFPRITRQDGNTNPKNIVAHRIELDVAKWLDIGLYEMVVFGNRQFEFAYLNPINFYRSAEHFVSDDDNASMGFDFEMLAIPSVKLYGELLIDDLNTGKSKNYFGNKLAMLAGGLWVDAFRLPNLDARLEYARTRPYIYTHRNDINKFTHFNTGMGHWIGPNADNLYARVQYRFSKSLYLAGTFEYYRHGDNEPDRNVGGSLDEPRTGQDSEIAKFLDGIVEKRTTIGLEMSYEIFRNLYLNLNFNTQISDNMLFSDGTRTDLDRKEFFVNIALNR